MNSAVMWALVVGLVVQGFVIYAAVRLAVFHHWLMVMRRDALEDEPAEAVDLEIDLGRPTSLGPSVPSAG